MPEITPSKYMVQASWDDVPHLSEEAKKELLESTPPHLRDARSKGIAALGSGAIYPIPLDDILVEPFEIPAWWPRLYVLDVGWKRTAALWMAYDRQTGIRYAYSEHYQGRSEPSIHAAAIKARGEWIPGLIDSSARGRSARDGERLMEDYKQLGLHLSLADKAVESGIYKTWQALASGRLKVFRTLMNFRYEYMIYRRDEDGHIVKEHDHLMDCLRYAENDEGKSAVVRPVESSTVAQSQMRARAAIGGDPMIGY